MLSSYQENLRNSLGDVAGDGRVLLYDLSRDTEHPVKTLDVCGASAPVFDLAFNVRAPELFATTDQQCVKVSHEM